MRLAAHRLAASCFAIACCLAIGGGSAAWAQDQTPEPAPPNTMAPSTTTPDNTAPYAAAPDSSTPDSSVTDRLTMLEREMSQLQREVDHSGDSGQSQDSGTAPPDSGSGSSGSGPQMLAVTVRMDNLETKMRELTGQLEELQYGISQAKTRLDKMQSDDEARFQALEHPGMGRSANNAPPPGDAGNNSGGGGGGGAGPLLVPPQGVASNSDQTGDDTGGNGDNGNGGSGDNANNGGGDNGDASSGQDAAPGPVTLPAGTPAQQYAFAYGLLRQENWAGAQHAFTLFLKKHPTDTLAGNSQYWLGETYFVQNQFQQAAVTFALGYKKYPKSSKAPDNLLKLGISLGNIGRRQNACVSFAKLDHEYAATVPAALKDLEKREKAKLHCGR